MSRLWLPLLGVALAACVAPTTGGGASGEFSDDQFHSLADTASPTTCDEGGPKVVGRINEKYVALGGCESVLGKPVGEERGTPDGIGRFSVFEKGSIYWTPAIGAFSVHGAILGAWASSKWEAGPLGYPTSDEYAVDGGRKGNFERGSITWTEATGKTSVQVSDEVGQATYYYFNGGGACGLPTPPGKLIAAINDEEYSKANCGRCASVKGPNGTVVLKILDKCPGCGPGDLDLSQEAFSRIASTSAGRVKISWHFVDCP